MKSKYLKFALLSAIVCFSQLKTVNAQTAAPCATDQMTEALYLQLRSKIIKSKKNPRNLQRIIKKEK